MKALLHRISQLIFLVSLSVGALAQNPEGFDKMAKKMADKTVPIIKTPQVLKLQKKGKKVIFLDARELAEYKVSHIKDAIHIGYDNFKLKSVSKLDKNATIVVYCSVGYRSGKIGKKLREAGFTSVFNLWGGLFDWANNGNPIYSEKGKVKKVHPYNTKWGKWLKPELRSKLD
ncbi:MAG: rhodanese-like domain-containing protein [Flavobacteriales bacterium]